MPQNGKKRALVTVIIVNWNGRQMLAGCLEALYRQTFRSFDITVVDNGSEDDSVAFVSSTYPKVNLVSLKDNIGFACANNMAIQNSRSTYVALINNDAYAKPAWLEELVDALEKKPEAGMAASKMLYADNPEIIDRVGDGYSLAGAGILRGRGKDKTDYSRPEWIFGACAGAALYRRDMLEKVGLFDENFFLLYEDVDLSFRAQLAGYKCIFVPNAIVYHHASQTIRRDSETSIYFGHRNLEWTYIHNMPGQLIARTLIPHCLYIVFSFLFFTSKGQLKIFLKAKKDALIGFNKAIRRRKYIQQHRKVDSRYFWQLLSSEFFVSRYKRRFTSKNK
jgi:GT2 family glycosyltransferase